MDREYARKQIQSQATMPKAKQADETSIHRISSLGKETNKVSAMSFQDVSNGGDYDPQRAPSMLDLDASEYGVPVTEDADNMPTMAQLSVKFGADKVSVAKESGVFGGIDA